MGIESWFTFESKEERERKRREYENKIFPFGERQKQHISDLLEQHVASKRSPLTDCLFMYVSCRQLLADEAGEDSFRSWAKSSIGKHMSAQDREYIRALAELDFRTSAEDRFVTHDEVCGALEKGR